MCNEDVYIADFGIFCQLNGINFAFSFDFDRDLILTFSDGRINFESYLIEIERITQKKTRLNA